MIDEDLIPVRTLVPDVPEMVDRAIEAGLSLRASDRPQTAQAFEKLLRINESPPEPPKQPTSKKVHVGNHYWKWVSLVSSLFLLSAIIWFILSDPSKGVIEAVDAASKTVTIAGTKYMTAETVTLDGIAMGGLGRLQRRRHYDHLSHALLHCQCPGHGRELTQVFMP